VRTQRSKKLADYNERYRTQRDVQPLLDEILRPLNERKTRPESTLPLEEFVEHHFLPFVEENCKPSTIAGYRSTWKMYLASRLHRIVVRDFRTVDAANLLAEIHQAHNLGRTTLHHIKSFLGSVFTYAKNQGVVDGVNPIHGAMIPKRASSEETHAATLDEVLAIMDVLAKASKHKARAAVALIFFAGLRPGEARGASWEDFDGRQLVVRQSIWHTHTTSPKTKSSAKPVPIIEPLRAILAELRESDGNPVSGPILRGASGKPLDLHNLGNRVVIPALKQADPPIVWYGWYALRRGIATTIADLSNSVAAKGLLRHSSISTTERHYIKDVPESTNRAMRQLEALLKVENHQPN